MTRRFSAILLQMIYMIGLCSAGAPGPDAAVNGLYQQVVAGHPLGIPRGKEMKNIERYLSQRMIRALDDASACQESYTLLHANDTGKPAFVWLERGIFSGANERALPSNALIQDSVAEPDGSTLVYVQLEYRSPSDAEKGQKPRRTSFHWRVAARVIVEGRRLVVDDVYMLRDDSTEIQTSIYDSFPGCEGRVWKGK